MTLRTRNNHIFIPNSVAKYTASSPPFFLTSREQSASNIMEIRKANEEELGTGRKKKDCGGSFVLQIPVPEKHKILIAQLPVKLSS